ncbi:hypothetical protein P154DRAFT_539536 [Amniculicola lignicola CBS 123094]|uniref:Uncharacterized protein n=1 Tax=Amniculicola lignicola CBS 123094 TaxID=1392246 RepID=A0A6A5WA15_9PLEO|nr:hypothetical protein P154DRAFT_539536 [Amniculicola lignicola CBS 123094]
MKSHIFATVLSFLSFTTAELVPALRWDSPGTKIDARQSKNPLLGKRQTCDLNYPLTCSAIDGDTLCMATDEICCQWISTSGTYPFLCAASYPYCCPPINGMPQCGTDATCGSGGFNPQSSHGVVTETFGPTPTQKSTSVTPLPPTVVQTVVATSTKNMAQRLDSRAIEGGILVTVLLGVLVII